MKRRDFLTGLAVTSATLAAGQTEKPIQTESPYKRVPRTQNPKNIIICAANGYNYIDAGFEKLRQGADTLDAALAVVSGPENDPNDDSVGLGGLPNEEGVVELDSSCFHGPTRQAGAVGGVRNIKNVSLLAKAVMEHTGHVMLVAEGAERFAAAIGFPKENLLTDRSRKIWLLWKETNSNQDWWGPGLADPKYPVPPGTQPPAETISELWDERIKWMLAKAEQLGIGPEYRMAAVEKVFHPPTGTIHISALKENGEISGLTTTSGLAWKIPGRLGDSPIIGAGCYTDPEIGSAGATGSGEENIKVVGAHTIVENMRHGMSAREAGLDALRRIAHAYKDAPAKLRFISMRYYILRRDGDYSGVTMWSGSPERPAKFAVHDGTKRLENCVALFQGSPLPFPPQPHDPYERPVPK